MNKAQKRTWLTLVISFAGISLGVIVVAAIKMMRLDMANTNQHMTFRLLSLPLTIPLILMIILSWRIPTKKYDERDRNIQRKAAAIGILVAFVFLGAAAWFLCVITKMGSIKALVIIHLVYLSVFVWFFITSVAALIQYGWGGKDGEK